MHTPHLAERIMLLSAWIIRLNVGLQNASAIHSEVVNANHMKSAADQVHLHLQRCHSGAQQLLQALLHAASCLFMSDQACCWQARCKIVSSLSGRAARSPASAVPPSFLGPQGHREAAANSPLSSMNSRLC